MKLSLLFIGGAFFLLVSGAETARNAAGEKVLSRKKRYLIFPEGSSLQLVYCLTMPILGESTIFTIGGTAALAWELPHDPLTPFRKPAEIAHRIDTKKTVLKEPIYVKKPPTYFYKINNPYPSFSSPFLSSSAASSTSSKIKSAEAEAADGTGSTGFSSEFSGFSGPSAASTINLSPAYKYHQALNNRPPQLLNLGHYPFDAQSSWNYDPHPVYIHRRTRRDLYRKIEKFITAQNKDGKSCVLKAVCESHQRGNQKGSFMEEILKAIFKVKPFESHPNEDEYDLAADPGHNCTRIYPECNASITQFIM